MDSNEFKRGNFEKQSPTKPADRPVKNADDGFAIKRSDKPRVSGEEEKKQGTFQRGPPRESKQEDTGFARANFTAKKAEDSGPPKRSQKPAGESSTTGAGFGFRNTNAAAKSGKGPAKK